MRRLASSAEPGRGSRLLPEPERRPISGRLFRSAMDGILVSAVSQNHFPQLRGLVQSGQRYLPDSWRIIVYDLLGDLRSSHTTEIASWCGVEYRRFDPRTTNATWDPRYLTLSVWKPPIIKDSLMSLGPGGIVLYADAAVRLHGPLSSSLIAAVQEHGFLGRQTASPVSSYTHPQMAIELGNQRHAQVSLTDYATAPMVCGCISLWARKPFVVDRLLDPWMSCTTRPACILPPGADGQDNRAGLSTKCRPGLEGHCHRGDQSALSIILYDAFEARKTGSPLYLRNSSSGAETWRMNKAVLHGTLFTTERFSTKSVAPMRRAKGTHDERKVSRRNAATTRSCDVQYR